MIEIGKIQIMDETSIAEARNKVRILAQDLEFSSVDATKLAAITSDLSRVVYQNGGESSIVVGLDRTDDKYSLALRFQSDKKDVDISKAGAFFDTVCIAGAADGQGIEAFKAIPDRKFRPTQELSNRERHPIKDESSIVEVRNKVRLLARKLNFGSVEETKLATIASDLCRSMYQSGGESSIVFGYGKRDDKYGLLLNFHSEGKEIDAKRAGAFFNDVSTAGTKGGHQRVQAFKVIPEPEFEPSEEFIDLEKERLIRLSTAEMMSEVSRKNEQILQLYEDIKKQKEEIENWNEELEEKVQKRTVELEEANADLRETTQMMLQAEKMGAVGTMTAGVAHELNNPMMGILNFIQFCIERTDEEDRRYKYLRKAEDATKRCAEIVKNLLTFSHMKRDAEEFYTQQEINVLFQRIRDLISYRVSGNEIKLDIHNGDGVPPIWMVENNIQQVFLNLVINALDAIADSERKEIRIDIKSDGEFVNTSISDTGCGIDAKVISRIFDPFFTTKPVGKGTGLGLSVSRNIIDKHGGVVQCESEPGLGTTFRVLLPIEQRRET